MTERDARPLLLLVDDEPANLHILRHILEADYRLLFARDGERALALAESEGPDLILLDVMMPGLTGHDVCSRLKGMASTRRIPVIFVTALSDPEDEAEGFEQGAVDYITKPVSAPIVRARVRTHLSLVRAEELRETRLHIVQCLGIAAEYKDNETGTHVLRMSHYAWLMARAAGYSDDEAEDLLHAAPMHDVGKIGIPDAILQKPDRLTPDEWEVMKQHVEIGGHILGQQPSRLMRMARDIALGHHEKWDGTGYPAGLRGEQISRDARIVAIADVFDALTSRRPYKEAWSETEAVDFIRRESGRHFDPELVEVFLSQLPAIREIRARWPDE